MTGEGSEVEVDLKDSLLVLVECSPGVLPLKCALMRYGVWYMCVSFCLMMWTRGVKREGGRAKKISVEA